MATRRSKDEVTLATLTASKDVAQTAVQAARAKCTALNTPEQLVELITAKTPEANDVRLRLRTEIRKRVSRIDIDFDAVFHDDGTVVYHQRDGAGRFFDIAPHRFRDYPGPVARIEFVNGSDRFIVLDGDGAELLWTKV
jgi:hypothetical protein